MRNFDYEMVLPMTRLQLSIASKKGYPLTVWPCGAGPRPAEKAPKDTPKVAA